MIRPLQRLNGSDDQQSETITGPVGPGSKVTAVRWRPQFGSGGTPDDAAATILDGGESPYSSRGITILAIVSALLANVAGGLARIDVLEKNLIYTDGLVRYARILDLLQGRNGWFDGWIHWSNSPFGHSMHWTRPFDVLTIVLSTPLAPFIGWEDAVYWIAIASGPLSHVCLILVVYWVGKFFVPRQAAAIAGFIVGLQPLVLGYSWVGRFDHHILILVLAMATLGLTLRSMVDDSRHASAAGVCAGIALWVSTESVLPIGLSIASLIVVWVARGTSLDNVLKWSRAFTSTSLVAILVELGPRNITDVEYDRISLPYLVAGAAAWIGFIALSWLLRRRQVWASRLRARFACLVVAQVIPVTTTLLMFPNLANGPFADTSIVVWDIWLSSVDEIQSIWTNQHLLSAVLFRLFIPLVGLVCAIDLISRRDSQELLWKTIVAWLIVLIPLACVSDRLALYPEALATIPVAATAWNLVARRSSTSSFGMIAQRTSIIATAVVGHILLGSLAGLIGGIDSARGETAGTVCRVDLLTDAVERSTPVDGSILAHIDLGPALHVRTGRDVIVTPHHRNEAGIIDAYMIMVSPPDEALRRIARRGIDALVICPSADTSYLRPLPADSLYGRLLADDPPPWLTEVESGTSAARLFVVNG